MGQEINPHVFSRQEFMKRLKSREHFVANVMKPPKLFVEGGEHEIAAMVGWKMEAPGILPKSSDL